MQPLDKATQNETTRIPISESTGHELTFFQASKDLIRFAVPLLFRGATLTAGGILKPMIISRDQSLLAAYSDIRSTEILLQSFLFRCPFSIPSLVSSAKAEAESAAAREDRETQAAKLKEIGTIFRQSMIFSAALGTIFVLIGFNLPRVFTWFDQPETVIDNSRDYFIYVLPGYFCDALYRGQVRFMTGLSIKKTALLAEFFDIAMDLTITDILIAGMLCFPKMDLASAAIGYSLSKFITLLLHTAVLFCMPALKPYDLFKCTPFFDKEIIKTIAKKGIPLGVDSFAGNAALMAITIFCGQRGEKGLIAIQVSNLYNNFVLLALSPLTIGTNVLIGKYKKNHASRNVVTLGNATIALCLLITTTTLMAALFLPQYIAAILVKPADLGFETSLTFLKIKGGLQILGATKWSIACALSGLQDNFIPMLISISCDLILNVGAAAVAHYVLDKDETFIFASQLLGLVIGNALIFARWSQQSKKYKGPADVASNPASLFNPLLINAEEEAPPTSLSIQSGGYGTTT